MGTHARIGYINDNGKYESCYVHYDGYPAGAGKTLMDHYPNLKVVKALVKGGDMSAVEAFIGEINYYGEPASVTNEVCLMGEEYGYVYKEGKWHVFTEKTSVPVEINELVFAS